MRITSENYNYSENKNMPNAYLHLLKNMGDELKKDLCNPNDLRTCQGFKGERYGCRKSVIGFKDCCRDRDSWGVQWHFI